MSHALTTSAPNGSVPAQSIPSVPWRDPHGVSPAELAGHIARLEQACLDHPRSADLRTCLGMAYAMNYEVYKSMDALEAAAGLDPQHFWAQMKLAELQYRLRALDRAEEETRKALDLASTPWQFSVAKKQLLDVREMRRASIRNVSWTKSLKAPTLVLSAMILVLFIAMAWK